MAEERFLVEDIPTGIIKTQDLAIGGWSVGEVINRPGALTGSLSLSDQDATEEVLAPWRTAVYYQRDGSIEWGGIMLPPSLALGSNTLDLACFGWLGYWDRRTIRTDRRFGAGDDFPDATEQFVIVQTLIEDAQDEAVYGDGWDLGITVEWDALSGIVRERVEEYRDFNAKNLGEALRQLAAVVDGFDFAMQYTINTSTDRIDKAVRLFYPRKGRSTGFVFEYDRTGETNVIARGFADTQDFAWSGEGWGSGADVTRLRSSFVDDSLRGVFPPFDGAPTWSSVIDPAVLAENTEQWFRTHGRQRFTPVLRVDPAKYPLWGDWALGDEVGVRIDDGYGSTDATGPQTNRITGWQIADSGNDHQIIVADPNLEMSA